MAKNGNMKTTCEPGIPGDAAGDGLDLVPFLPQNQFPRYPYPVIVANGKYPNALP